MAILNFLRKAAPTDQVTPEVETFLRDFSIEVMPRTAEKVESFRAILPAGTRVYIAHIEGTPIEDIVATAARINAEGFEVMPHFPARIIKDRATRHNLNFFRVFESNNGYRAKSPRPAPRGSPEQTTP